MKIISWNCNMAFRKKFHKILEQKPDLLIVIECENEAKLNTELAETAYQELLWFGENPHKGIAVIRFGNFQIAKSDNYNPEFKYIIPLQLIITNQTINLFVIWAMPHPNSTVKSYVGQIWGAIQYYEKELNANSILIGDFNSNVFWDKQRKSGNHSDVVEFLEKKNIHSLYHRQNAEAQGAETQPTQYMYRHEDKPYHLDYCFLSKALISDKTILTVGTFEEWIEESDHMPLFVSF